MEYYSAMKGKTINTHKNLDESPNNRAEGKNLDQKNYMIPFTQNREKMNKSIVTAHQRFLGTGEVGGKKKGHKGTFDGDGYVYCLDCGDGFRSVCMSKLIKLYTLNVRLVCQLCLNKTSLKKCQPLQFPTNPTLVYTAPQVVINGSESLNSSPIGYPWFR